MNGGIRIHNIISRRLGRCLVILSFFFTFAVPGAFPQLGEISSGSGSARQLRFEVSDFKDPQAKRWIHLSCEFDYTYRESMENVITALWDFKDSPKTFSRVEAVRVRSDTGTVAVTEQRTGIRILGFAFISNLVLRNVLVRRGPGAATFNYESIETDGSCLSTTGAWEMEDRSDSSGPATYVRFTLDSYVEPRFPGQATIMRGFGAADIKKIIRELGQSILRS